MKKYLMSFIDYSEIINVTADQEQLQNAKKRMTELGLLTDKGNIRPSQIDAVAVSEGPAFFAKLDKRLRRRAGGIAVIKGSFQKLYDERNDMAMFLYLAFWYGLLEWQLPEPVVLLPAIPAAMSRFFDTFMEEFEKYMAANHPEREADQMDDTEQESI